MLRGVLARVGISFSTSMPPYRFTWVGYCCMHLSPLSNTAFIEMPTQHLKRNPLHQMDTRVDIRKERWMDGWMAGWTDGWKEAERTVHRGTTRTSMDPSF